MIALGKAPLSRYFINLVLVSIGVISDAWFGAYYVNQAIVQFSPKGGEILNVFSEGAVNAGTFLKISIVVSALSWVAFATLYARGGFLRAVPVALKCAFYSAPFLWGHSIVQEW